MSNDKRITMELEAGSGRSHWEREVSETGWLVVKSGSFRDALEMLFLFLPQTLDLDSSGRWI